MESCWTIMLPGRDGLSVLRVLREKGLQTPVRLLSARSHLTERMDGLNAGADDYLAKPFARSGLGLRRWHLRLRLPPVPKPAQRQRGGIKNPPG